MLYKVEMVTSKTHREGVVLPFRCHKVEFHRGEMSTEELENQLRSSIPDLESIKVSRIPFEAFEKLAIGKAKQSLGGHPYCLTSLNFRRVYEESNDPIEEMGRKIHDNSIF